MRLSRARGEGRQWEGAHLPPRLLVLTRASTRERRGVGRWFTHYVRLALLSIKLLGSQHTHQKEPRGVHAHCARLFARPEGRGIQEQSELQLFCPREKMLSISLTYCDSKTRSIFLRQTARLINEGYNVVRDYRLRRPIGGVRATLRRRGCEWPLGPLSVTVIVSISATGSTWRGEHAPGHARGFRSADWRTPGSRGLYSHGSHQPSSRGGTAIFSADSCFGWGSASYPCGSTWADHRA